MPKKLPKKSVSFYLLWMTGILLVSLVAIAIYAYQAIPKTQYAWVQYGPNDAWIARVITSKDNCPSLTINEKQYPMTVRVPMDKETPVTTCELTLPNTATQISLGDTILPVPKMHAKKILVIGDTGCSLQKNRDQQCHTATDWVFPKVSEIASQTNPDLIIHVGDYMYREKPGGYNWKTLEADFFAPAKPLLTKATWLFVRGNHEECNRGGNLWFRFQGADPYKKECIREVNPFAVHLANLQLLSIDSSTFPDYEVQLDQAQHVKSQLANIPLNPNYWLVSYRPLWGIKVIEDADITTTDSTVRLPATYEKALLKYNNGQSPSQKLVGFNDTLQQSLTKEQYDLMGLALSGHSPNFESISFDGALPPQIIAGNTAREFEKEITASVSGIVIGGKPVTESKFYPNVGYMLLEEQTRDIWQATQYSPDGQEIFSCEYRDRRVICN